MGGSIGNWVGGRIGKYLSQIRHVHSTAAPIDSALLMDCLQPGDVLLVEGQSRISTAIKYLTQSTWSHAALFTGPLAGLVCSDNTPGCFIEADIRDGVRAVGFAEYAGLHCRVCRPIGLEASEIATLTEYARTRLGHRYDLRNVFDLARYLFPTPPVPQRWRRRMLSLGSGDPTRAICSTMIAQAFESIRYPILPVIESRPSRDPWCPGCLDEIFHVRHHSLFVPRDFDVSPYFAVVKPTLAADFDPHRLIWESSAAVAADATRLHV